MQVPIAQLLSTYISSITEGKYEIRVTTSDLQNAATHAQVSITVYGEKGNSGKLPLGSSGPDSSQWDRGKVYTDTVSPTDNAL